MGRNSIARAIVLKTTRFAEIHKGVTMLTPELGIIEAAAFGAFKGKGKLSGSTVPFTLATAYLYHDPVKGSYKINDMEQIEWFEGIRQNLKKYYLASFWAEIILKSFGGGGEYDTLFQLYLEALQLLDCMGCGQQEDRGQFSVLLIQFLWRYILLAGFCPDIEECASCGRIMEPKEDLYLSSSDNIFSCVSCSFERSLLLTAGARKYLKYTENLSLERSLSIGLDGKSLGNLKTLLLILIQSLVESPLNTLKQGVL